MRPSGILTLMLTGCAPRLYSADADLPTVPSGTAWTAPDNRWPSAAPPASFVGEGFAEGQIALDIRGADQFGETVSLWQFYGLHVLVDISTMWCSPCQELGKHTESTWQRFKDEGFVYLTVLHEDVENGDVSQEELNEWATLPSHGSSGYETITAPILSDPQGVSGSVHAVVNNQYPVALLVGPDMRVLDRVEPVTSDRVDQVIEAALD